MLSAVPALIPKKEEVAEITLRFCLAISIEYQDGKIDYKNRNDLDRELRMSLMEIVAEKAFDKRVESEGNETPYYKQFIERYFANRRWLFLGSLFDVITGGGKLDIKKFQGELKVYYHIQDNAVAEHQALMDMLQNQNVTSLSDKEYNGLTRSLLDFAEKGVYSIASYPTVFYYLTRFGNPLRLKNDRLVERLLIGMRKRIKSQEYVPSLEMYFGDFEKSPNADYHRKLIEEAFRINNKLKLKSDDIISVDIQNDFYRNTDTFIAKVIQPNSEFSQLPLFHHFDPRKFYYWLIKLDNMTLTKVSYLFYHRISKCYPNHLRDEFFFVEQLVEIIEKGPYLSKPGLKASTLRDIYSSVSQFRDQLVK